MTSELTDARHAELHARARAMRASRMWLYRLVRTLLRPLLTLYFRPEITNVGRVPERGAAILAANHRSFFDSFFQGLAVERPMHWMAKAELFARPSAAWFLVRVGAFPVRRGQADTDAVETARQLLLAGELVGIFPEGTRVKEGLGEPRRGVGRLSAETGAPLVPMAIVGTERLRWLPWQRRERVRMEFGEPVAPPPGAPPTPEVAGDLVSEQLWPRVRELVGRQESRRAAAAAGGLAAAGIAAYRVGRRRRR